MSRSVVLEAYNHEWPNHYEAEARVIKMILGANLVEIHHIGSTSIPGISAKPIIDILPVVQSIMAVDEMREAFLREGFLYRGEYGMVGRRYVVGLAPNGETHRVHIHIFEQGHDEISRHLSFRDHLRSDSRAAKEYETLKLHLKTTFNGDRDKYQSGKGDFCEELLRTQMGDRYRPPAPWPETDEGRMLRSRMSTPKS